MKTLEIIDMFHLPDVVCYENTKYCIEEQVTYCS